MKRKSANLRLRKAALQQIAIGAAVLLAAPVVALVQQVTGTPGSPGATTTINGKQRPPPDPKF
jgi:arylsulfatase